MKLFYSMRKVMKFSCITLFMLCSFPAIAQEQPVLGAASLENRAVELLQEYVRVDTVNPPGNEIDGARFFAKIFAAAGIEYEMVESAPGRGNIWARINGGDKPGLVLLHHMDVVPSNAEFWTFDPLGGEIQDEMLYGRGVVDDKAAGIAHLLTFLELFQRDQPLNRDLIFMATADEEAGGHFGAGWLVKNRPEIFAGVGTVINEGGIGITSSRDGVEQVTFNVEVTQKVPLWLKLVAVDVPGHGSMPRSTSSVTRLVQALSNIVDHPFQPQPGPAVVAYFKAIAPSYDEPTKSAFSDIALAARNDDFMQELQQQNPLLHALTRNTCSITMLNGSSKINVVPPKASAQLDCRLVPEQDPDLFVNELASIINDETITIERIMGFSPAVSSTDTESFRVIEAVTEEYYPNATVVPSVVAGFTDSHFFRDMGIQAYGYHPVVIPVEDFSGIHGNDERLSLQNIRQGSRMIFNVVSEMVYSQ
jgi:acetylornithine deacetylase/succinyl-diaminopimelate desuccinylase-like protein